MNKEVVEQISEMKGEPQWMRDFRLKALEVFWQKPTPTWGGELLDLNYDDIHYYMKAADRQGADLGRHPQRDQEYLRQAGHPRGRAHAG